MPKDVRHVLFEKSHFWSLILKDIMSKKNPLPTSSFFWVELLCIVTPRKKGANIDSPLCVEWSANINTLVPCKVKRWDALLTGVHSLLVYKVTCRQYNVSKKRGKGGFGCPSKKEV